MLVCEVYFVMNISNGRLVGFGSFRDWSRGEEKSMSQQRTLTALDANNLLLGRRPSNSMS